MVPFAVLIGASVVLSVAALGVRKGYEGEVPPTVAMLFIGACIPVLGGLMVWAAFGASAGTANGYGAIFFFPLALACATPVFLLMGHDAAGGFAELLVSRTFDSSLLEPMPSDFSRARKLTLDGDINGALNEYWKYYEEDPKKPTALFALCRMLEKEQRYDQAQKYYRELIRRFEPNRVVWAEASLRSGDLYANHMKKTDEARKLYHAVVKRTPRLKQGHLAAERLAEVSSRAL